MKCLSIRQPWAWAILTGQHSVEYRCYPTKYRGPLLVHAARQAGEWDRKQLALFGKQVPRWDELVFGRVVGIVELWACHACPGGEWAWCLRNPHILEPFRLKPGKHLFEVEDYLLPPQALELCASR